jgi:hypothetical protein
MTRSRQEDGVGAPPSPGAAPVADAPEPPVVRELTDAERALLGAVSEQAELLALLTASVQARFGPLDGPVPAGAVDLVGALGSLESPGTPGSDPLHAFGLVAPRFGRDAEQVVDELGVA